MLAAIPPPHRPPTFTNLMMESAPYSHYSLCITIGVLLFAIAIIRNGWGMGYRLSLIPVSLMPLLIGFGATGWNLMNGLAWVPPVSGLACGLTYSVREYYVILPFCLFQTILLLGVTAWTFLNMKNGPLAAVIAPHPAE